MIPLRLAIAAAGAAALFGFGGWVGYEWRDAEAAKDDLKRERAEKESRDEQQRMANRAGTITETKLTEAARTLAAVRADADGVRDLSREVARSAGKACVRDAERVRQLSGLVAEGARLLEEAEGIAGRLDARLSGCQAAP